MTETALVPIPADQAGRLIATAARAPSVHNTQPWRFKVGQHAIELHADYGRRLHLDVAGREMLISCGAALFGLRLAIRELGYLPVVSLLPAGNLPSQAGVPARPRLLARVTLGASAPITTAERKLLKAITLRHTHRGPFSAEPLPVGLLAGLQQEALAEGAALDLIDQPGRYQQLVKLAAMARRRQATDPVARAEVRHWSRLPDSLARDGIPARAFPAAAANQPGTLAQRDFDLGRGIGALTAGGPPASATAILLTPGDNPADWLRAGQALHRVLTRAAASWVFARLSSEPLEVPAVRALVRSRLGLRGHAQLLLQFGRSATAEPTARRPPRELLIEPGHQAGR
jgi:nitroreductase